MNIYYDIAKYISTEIIDVDFDANYVEGEIVIDLRIKIPIAEPIEKAVNNLLTDSK